MNSGGLMRYIIILSFLCILLSACSTGTNTAIPSDNSNQNLSMELTYLPVYVSDTNSDGSPSEGFGIMGLFNLSVNPDGAQLTPIRRTSLADVLEVVDITNFLALSPCTDCVKINKIALDSDGNIIVTIGIKHPFPVGDPLKPVSGKNRADLHVFNVEGIVISNSEAISYPGLGQTVANFKLVNADGYTGYLDTVIDEFYPTDASIHPYITHFDDYSAGNFSASNPMGFQSVTYPPPSGNLVMAMGCDYNYQDYVFDLTGVENMEFIFAVGCTYAVSAASKSMRFSPEYRVPQHNKKAASEINFEIVSNDLKGGNTSSTAQIEIHVVDVSHGVAVGTALNEMLSDSSVHEIRIEIPGVTSIPVIIDGSSSVSGTGHSPSDPLIYEATITNALGAMEGTYTGLIKVTDNYAPGQNTSQLLNGMDGIKRVDPSSSPLSGLFAIPEFATYQVFSVDIIAGAEITVIKPNGGEQWWVETDEEITWASVNVSGTVFVEYSKDNFVSDIHTIATDVPNTGSFLWENIPDDPSNTVRVRISSTANPSVNDISDEDFSIIRDSIWWKSHMYNLKNIGWNPTANMPNPSALQQQWVTPNAGYKFTTPVIADDKIYFSVNSTYWERSDMTFFCYSITGAELWRKSVNLTSVSTSWRVFSCPVWWHGDDDIDRVAVGGDKVYCFNADTGGQLWTYDTTYLGNDVGWWSNQMQEYKGMVLARSRYNPLYVLDFKTGNLISTVICSETSEGGCTAKDGKVYINSSTYVDCADIMTGGKLWSTQLPSAAGAMNHWVTPALIGDRIYVTTINAYVCCLSIADGGGYSAGQIIWTVNDPLVFGSGMMAGASARQSGGVTRLYIPSSGSLTYVYCIEDQGNSASIIWRSSRTGSYEGAAVWANAPGYPEGVVYCPDAYGGTLYAFNASNGTQIWSYSAGPTITKCGVSIVDNMLVLMSNSDVRLLK